MGMMSNMFGTPPQNVSANGPQISMSFTNPPNMTGINNLLGNLGIRLPPMAPMGQ